MNLLLFSKVALNFDFFSKFSELRIKIKSSTLLSSKSSIIFNNLSVAPSESNELGTKVEIKNMNSLRSLERAIDFEIKRQSLALENGDIIIQETRHWDESKETTTSMRSKEGSADYRYFS